MKRWEQAKDIQIENGDLLITKDGTVGKVAIVDGLNGPASLNSGVLRISTFEGYDRRFLFWVLQSDVFWTWFSYRNAGNSTIIHLYQMTLQNLSILYHLWQNSAQSPIILIINVHKLNPLLPIWNGK